MSAAVAVLPRKSGGAARTPERQGLADVIARVVEAQTTLEGVAAAEQIGYERVLAARAGHEAAVAAIAEAKEAEVDAIMETARSGRVDAPPPLVAQARRRVTDAEDALATAQAAHGRLKQARVEAEAALQTVRGFALSGAVSAIVAPAADRLTAEIEALNAEMVRKRMALRWLVQNQMVGDTRRAFEAMSRPMPDLTTGGIFLGGWKAGADAVWQDAAAALQKDPDAPLPI